MALRSLFVHYKNKYPKARVMYSDQGLDVIQDSELLLALRKNGAGQVVDAGEMLGARDRHDLSPLPKDARQFKLYRDGRVGKSEEHAERSKFAAKIAVSGRVPSCEELAKPAKEGEAPAWEFDQNQRCVRKPEKF